MEASLKLGSVPVDVGIVPRTTSRAYANGSSPATSSDRAFVATSKTRALSVRERVKPSRAALLKVAELLAILLAGLTCASIVQETIEDLSRPLPELHLGEPPSAPVPAPKPSLAHYAAITERDIFNVPRPVEPPPPVAVTPLDRRLVGIGRFGARPYAILETASGVQEIHHVGAIIAGRTLAEIGRDEIVLREGEREETLRLPIPVSELAARLAGGKDEERARDRFVLAAFAPRAPSEPAASAVDVARVEPVFHEKKLLGLRVSALRSESFLEALGLESGDVIRKIGERTLSDPLGAIRRFRGLRPDEEVSLEVSRGDQTLLLPRDAERPEPGGLSLAALLEQRAKEPRRYRLSIDERARTAVRRQLQRRWVPPSMREIEVRVSES